MDIGDEVELARRGAQGALTIRPEMSPPCFWQIWTSQGDMGVGFGRTGREAFRRAIAELDRGIAARMTRERVVKLAVEFLEGRVIA